MTFKAIWFSRYDRQGAVDAVALSSLETSLSGIGETHHGFITNAGFHQRSDVPAPDSIVTEPLYTPERRQAACSRVHHKPPGDLGQKRPPSF
jgi:hypothetical protein